MSRPTVNGFIFRDCKDEQPPNLKHLWTYEYFEIYQSTYAVERYVVHNTKTGKWCHFDYTVTSGTQPVMNDVVQNIKTYLL